MQLQAVSCTPLLRAGEVSLAQGQQQALCSLQDRHGCHNWEGKGWVENMGSLPGVRPGYIPTADVLLAAVPLEFTSSTGSFIPART